MQLEWGIGFNADVLSCAATLAEAMKLGFQLGRVEDFQGYRRGKDQWGTGSMCIGCKVSSCEQVGKHAGYEVDILLVRSPAYGSFPARCESQVMEDSYKRDGK